MNFKKIVIILSVTLNFQSNAALPMPDPSAPEFCSFYLEAETRELTEDDAPLIQSLKAQVESVWTRFKELHKGPVTFSGLDPVFRDEVNQLSIKLIELESVFGFDKVVELGLHGATLAQISNYAGFLPTKDDLIQLQRDFFSGAEKALNPSLSADKAYDLLAEGLWQMGAQLQQLPTLYNEVFPENSFERDYEYEQKIMGQLIAKMRLSAIKENQLTSIFNKIWSAETTASPSDWTEENPSWGQCAVTALVVQDILGGEIVWAEAELADGRKISHYKNLVDGREIDFTNQQFPPDTTIPAGVPKTKTYSSTRDYVLSYEPTRKRYDLLKSRLMETLN
ncbi:MAG: hypothetical protein KA116_02475 [Proteobacteria bacterium]|nr:hypothetical protein [Pseudomonadota bacterium]